MFDHKPILIVENDAYLALDMAMAVEELGGHVVGPAASVAEALTLLEAEPVAAAVLDCMLDDRDVVPVALLLAEQGVPFVLHTGTGLPLELAGMSSSVPVLMKPLQPKTVLAHLLYEMKVVGERSGSITPVPVSDRVLIDRSAPPYSPPNRIVETAC